MSDLATLRFFSTPAHACSYLEDHQATTLFVDPHARITPALYNDLTRMGFRRSGDYLYRPHCGPCQACIPARVRVMDFSPNRSQRRIMARNERLRVEVVEPRFTNELYQLYSRYIERRHGDGDMFPPSQEQFASFLMSSWSDTRFCCFRDEDDQLLAVAVMDQLADGLSAVYTFYEPNRPELSLGTYAILWQIRHCRDKALPHLYLGYWIRRCRKMRYKEAFQPLELLRQDVWGEYP
ncbi:arginyltransferase [Alcanivorax sp. JB21]|uniref:arginyltransferase n=1 Tax=Alcanivorax limicola TaxID=2874102 RepID=UPI001CC001F4|nr:arginyltransferase [Alcanivorax limicola]MBZ2187820.1 arginyltransferase [Alcanivorax limicola]